MNVGKYEPGKLSADGVVHLVDFETNNPKARVHGESDISLCSRSGEMTPVEPDGNWCQDCEKRALNIYGVQL